MATPNKEGLTTALEFTKFVMAVDAALIAFLTGATFLERIATWPEKIAVMVVLVLLAVSIGAGILVFMRVGIMMSEKIYDLADIHLRKPGQWNVICFLLGSVGVAVLAVLQLLPTQPERRSERQLVEIRCTMSGEPTQLAHCRGQMTVPAK